MAMKDADHAYVPQRKRRRAETPSATTAGSTTRPHEPPLAHHTASPYAASPYAASAAQEAAWARRESGISIEGEGPVPAAMRAFSELPLPAGALSVLRARYVEDPSPIQAQTLPCVFQGRDVVALAPTGSGKTLCYLLPMLALLQQQQVPQRQDLGSYDYYSPTPSATGPATPCALVVVPTRELMDQVLQDLAAFFPSSSSAPVVGICGGVALTEQLAQLQHHSNKALAVIATPGRLLHVLRSHTHALSLAQLALLVVDEVDRVIQAPKMETQLREVLQLANTPSRQTLLLSATLPALLPRLVRSAVLHPVTIRVGETNVPGQPRTSSSSCSSSDAQVDQITPTLSLSLATTSHVTHNVQFLRAAEKPSRLLRVLRETERPPVLVFCNSRASVEGVTRLLRHEQFHAAPLHGGLSQGYRSQALRAFRAGYVDVLVATDLASRGLDLPGVDHVVLFDMPLTIEDYVHRCGRTGRHPGGGVATNPVTGKATAFLTRDCAIAAELKQVLRVARQPVPRELELSSRFQPPPATTRRVPSDEQ